MGEYRLIAGQIEDDSGLVAAAQQGSERAFARLFERHATRLWHYASALSGGQCDEAQDLVQETFVRAWAQLGELRSGAAFHAWLRTLLYRLALDQRARQQRRERLVSHYSPPPGERTPEERLLSRETGAAIAAAARQLSDSSRRIFTAFHVEGQSIMEISEETGLTVGAVKARLFQGRKRLRKELEAMAPETTMPAETPEYLNISIMGNCEHQHDPLHPVRLTRSLLARRVLFFCRKGAKSAGELARLLHADKAYIEDIAPELVAGELLEEPFPGRYQTAFLFVARQDYEPLAACFERMRDGVAIVRRHLPRLKAALAETSLCGWQGFSWEQLAWIALPVWVASRGLGRQTANLPNWGKHRILAYPHRPVDHWYLRGDCGDEAGRTFRGPEMETSSDGKGMGNVGEPRVMVGGDPHQTLRWEDLDRFVGRLCDGPISEAELLAGADDGARERLAEYRDAGYLVQVPDGGWRLGMPVLTGADEERLLGPVDELCAELAGDALDRTLSEFVEKVDEQEFSHLLGQPHYLGFIGYKAASWQLMYLCRQEKLMPDPVDPPKGFGCYAWYGTTEIMRSWSRGR